MIQGQVQRAAESYGPGAVRVCSFTRAAAHEIARRLKILPEKNVGTLHSLCFHALGMPALTEGEEADFNDFAFKSRGNHDFEITVRKKRGKKKEEPETDSAEEPPASADFSRIDDPFENTEETVGDEQRSAVDLLRNLMVPKEEWPEQVRPFAKLWQEWKDQAGLLDFADLLEQTLYNFETCPGNPAAFFLDEAQDCSALQIALVRQWAPDFRRLILAGDDDQTIFSFAGASAGNLLDFPCAPENRRYLSPSYRVPRLIHHAANRWIRRVSRREDKKSLPRDAEGVILESRGSWYQPERLVDLAEKRISQGKRVMFLASCSYMLNPLLSVLRERGLPFHNPWRQKRGDWNPLRRGSEGSTWPLDRLLAFLSPDRRLFGSEAHPIWSRHSLALWAFALDARKNLCRGARKRLREYRNSHESAEMVDFVLWFLPEKHAELEQLNFSTHDDSIRSLRWLVDNILESQQKKYEYPVRVFERSPQALIERPGIVPGTGHSLKGSEADCCFVFPDLSRKGMRAWDEGTEEEKDSIIRLFYVMMTRSREELILCQPATRMALQIA
jgi:superfamily I DNA/RNA helicase